MIIPDINLLLYAHDAETPHHLRAMKWWSGVLEEGQTVGIPWVVLLGFIRLTTRGHVLRRPLSVAEAMSITDDWLASPSVILLEPGPRHYAIFRRLLEGTGGGNVVTDAHIAAMAIEHNATVYSNDTDFGRFSGLKWVNPLKP